MWQFVLLQLRKMVANQLRRQAIALAAHFELRQKAFANVTCTTTDRFEPHYQGPCLFDRLFRPAAEPADLFVRRSQPSIGVEIADYAFSGIKDRSFADVHA